jgi:hypothetical protein
MQDALTVDAEGEGRLNLYDYDERRFFDSGCGGRG